MFSIFIQSGILLMTIQVVFGETNFCNGTILERLSLRAICDFENMFGECQQKIPPGTVIQVNCAYGYSRESNTPQNLMCLPDGNFDQVPVSCKQQCGQFPSSTPFLTKNGIEIVSSKAPWHVGIYMQDDMEYHYVCAGSIISPTVVISAAHCFWDETNRRPNNSTNLHVIAGRSSRNFSTEQTEYSQIIKVLEVHIPEDYRGKEEIYRNDIALLKLTQPFKYNEAIAPICLPKDLLNTAFRYVHSDRIAFVVIFGKNNQLEQINVTTANSEECAENNSMTGEKFCAYATEDIALWMGNSGAGCYTANRVPFYYMFMGVLSHLVPPKGKAPGPGGQTKIAITHIYNVPISFKRELVKAVKEDEAIV